MNKSLIVLLAAVNSIAFGQSQAVNKSVEDDSKTMSVHFSATLDGQAIRYDHTIDLSFSDKSVPVREHALMILNDEKEVQTRNLGKKQSFLKEVRYNAEEEMYLHYHFIKNGEDFEYEKTLNAKGKPEKERQRIIKETEQEIGFSSLK